ncbi:hypothetical protein BV25DRAFT_1804386 [Artomyces pyxidatus]|uniref:Uncharacterized protein n=1 Tax=Artomyces pyxidatus TaxID=48021 RepID=A0ACB8T1W1_9AGAM|nr:hypothetical protein BV25DRAFT_1804386 [Artomyces pyxidatus]
MRADYPPPPASTFTPLPGPWSFFASGYAIALFAMALLLNRIQNIVVPSRHASPYHRNQRHRLSFFRYLYPSIFPLDLSSTYSRTVFRIPTLYFLLRALALWSVLLLQASGYFPSWKMFQSIDHWAAQKEMEDVCWVTFLSVCGALCVGALTRGLEGVGAANTSPFNLFGYAFLLHLYSSPVTHTVKLEGLPSRPDVHVIYIIVMPLLQLSMIHLLGVKRSWSNQRLIPTTICAVLTLVHFHSVLWFSPSSYPLLNYMSCIFESLLILTTLLAFVLHGLTQLLLEGAITRPFFGHAGVLMPKWDEDFSIVLLRLGTASLETTSVAGLGNEVSGVPLSKASKPETHYGEVNMNRAGVTSVSHAVEGSGSRTQRKEGFTNEVRNVKVGLPQRDPYLPLAWFREFLKFGDQFVRVVRGCWRVVWGFVRGRPVSPRPAGVSAPHTSNAVSASGMPGGFDGEVHDTEPEVDHETAYQQFLAGEPVSDDDEDEFDPRAVSVPPDHDDEHDEHESHDEEEETPWPFMELSQVSAAAMSTATAPLWLAHMTDASASPLTRRRYQSLVSGHDLPARESGGGEWEEFVDDRRAAADEKKRAADDTRRNCVICTVEERQIICWPCRCLALCDDCRENLASRFSASKHTCPCCRQPVEGFSRIYIP